LKFVPECQKLAEGPTGHHKGTTSQPTKKFRNDNEYGCRGCLYYLKKHEKKLKTQKQQPTESQKDIKYQNVR